MIFILWFSPKKDIWNAKKLKLYQDCATIFVLLLAEQYGEQKYMLCLGVLFNPEAEGIKIFRLSRGSSIICLFSFMM
jgi:hypothetical protein